MKKHRIECLGVYEFRELLGEFGNLLVEFGELLGEFGDFERVCLVIKRARQLTKALIRPLG